MCGGNLCRVLRPAYAGGRFQWGSVGSCIAPFARGWEIRCIPQTSKSFRFAYTHSRHAISSPKFFASKVDDQAMTECTQGSGSPTRIWTPETSRKFYRDINALAAKLKDGMPRVPEDYRQNGVREFERDGYVLAYEEELHLADHFAFLASFKEGVKFVSAATIEQGTDPIGFTVRVASNDTPTREVVDGLGRILGIVEGHAKEG